MREKTKEAGLLLPGLASVLGSYVPFHHNSIPAQCGNAELRL